QRSLLVGPVRRLVSSWELHRGFAEVVRSDADLFLTRAEQILAAAPGHTVQIDASTPGMHQLADCPHPARVSGLGLTFNYLTDNVLRVLLRSPHLRNLRFLDLRQNRLTNDGASAIAGCAALSRLRVLRLGQNAIGAGGVRALADSEYLQG